MQNVPSFRQRLTKEEKDDLRMFLASLEVFKDLRGTMPLQYVIALLLVALDEGEGTLEYARRAGVSPSVMSRHLLDIGDRNRHKEPGFGLVTQRQDPMNLSRHQCMLTPKGVAIIHRALRAIGGRNAA